MTIVEVETQDGLVGLGEAPSWLAASIIRDQIAAALIGDNAFDIAGAEFRCLPFFAAFRLATLRRSAALSAITLILAVWTIASPWVYGYAANVGAVRDNLIPGTAIATLASWSGSVTLFGQNHPPGSPARQLRAGLRQI